MFKLEWHDGTKEKPQKNDYYITITYAGRKECLEYAEGYWNAHIDYNGVLQKENAMEVQWWAEFPEPPTQKKEISHVATESWMDSGDIRQLISEMNQAVSDIESSMDTAQIYNMDDAYESLKDAKEAFEDAIHEADKVMEKTIEKETREWCDEMLFSRP